MEFYEITVQFVIEEESRASAQSAAEDAIANTYAPSVHGRVTSIRPITDACAVDIIRDMHDPDGAEF